MRSSYGIITITYEVTNITSVIISSTYKVTNIIDEVTYEVIHITYGFCIYRYLRKNLASYYNSVLCKVLYN